MYDAVLELKTAIKTLYHCVYNLNYHLVLVTKYRRKCITAAMLKRLKEHCTALVEKWECELLEFNGEPDPVHLLLSLNPTVAPSVFVNNLKTVTSRYIHKEFSTQLKQYYWNKPVFWSRSYYIISCGSAPVSVIKQSIEQQEATH